MPQSMKPSVVILSGPNGAGKSSLAPSLLQEHLGVRQFVNADVIAQGLAGFAPESSALAAGRIMLSRMNALAASRSSFAFETTLASRTFAPWLENLRSDGYLVHLIYLWLPSPEMAQLRVASRVRSGGHNVPPEVVTRRFYAGLRNFFDLYQAVSDTWRIYDSSGLSTPEPIALGSGPTTLEVRDRLKWELVLEARRE